MSSRPAHPGFTMVEVLAAGMILALFSAVLGVAARQQIRSLEMSRDMQQAAELADDLLGRLDAAGPSAVLESGRTSGTFDPPHDRFAWQVRIEPAGVGQLYEVTASVGWLSSAGVRKSVDVQTLLNDDSGADLAAVEGPAP